MSRLPTDRRRKILRELPPRRCSGRSSRTGRPCRRWAVVGAGVCPTHGAMAEQVRAAAERRVSFAEELARSPRRSPQQVLADALHTADTTMRQTVMGPDVNPDEVMGAVGRAAALAKLNLDADIDASQLSGDQSRAMAYVLVVAAKGLGMDVTEARVLRALAQALRFDPASSGSARRKDMDEHVAQVRASAGARDRVSAENVQAQHLDHLKGGARTGPCPVCDTLPAHQGRRPSIEARPVDRPVERSVSEGGPPSDGAGFVAERPTQRADGPTVDGGAPVVDGEVLDVVLPRRVEARVGRRCEGCREVVGSQAEHDRVCSWSQIAARPAIGGRR